MALIQPIIESKCEHKPYKELSKDKIKKMKLLKKKIVSLKGYGLKEYPNLCQCPYYKKQSLVFFLDRT